MADDDRNRRLARDSLRYLDDAYNLARWLMGNDADAQDAVQEAYLRALRFADGFRGDDPRAWLLKIVRNVCYSWLERVRPADAFDETVHGAAETTPESLALAAADRARLVRALEDLPSRFREVLVLRELEGCSYKEIAEITGVPLGTVMSSLSRARQRLRQALCAGSPGEVP